MIFSELLSRMRMRNSRSAGGKRAGGPRAGGGVRDVSHKN